jgi:hypothetical protein
MLAALKAHVKRLDQERRELGPEYQDHEVLSCWEDGRPPHPDTITRRFKARRSRSLAGTGTIIAAPLSRFDPDATPVAAARGIRRTSDGSDGAGLPTLAVDGKYLLEDSDALTTHAACRKLPSTRWPYRSIVTLATVHAERARPATGTP